jgi:hypothetical protein
LSSRSLISACSEEALLRHTVFVGLREDKPASEVRRQAPS